MIENKLKKNGRYVKILNIKVDSTHEPEVLAKIGKKVASKAKFYIVTPNPEIILRAQEDKKLAEILNSAEIAIADGTGLKIAEPSLTIVHGRNVFIALLREAGQKGWRVFFLGGTTEANRRAVKKARLLYKVDVVGEAGPSKLNEEGEPVSEVDIARENDVVTKINQYKPHLLFVAFGAPKQEKWIAKWLPKLNVNAAMVIGGALDYLAETAKLPPYWMEKLELEWLWRLIAQPERAGRVLNAALVFPTKVFLSKLRI